jgi:NAD(P)-dependent dehydrogenase (short-subunit alcohol dehydrogenase family)
MQTEQQLQGQVAVVSGAARGIGAAIAEHLAELGAHVFLTARDQKQLEVVRNAIGRSGGKATIAICDLVDAEAVSRLASTVREQTSRCDILVNCAGTGVFGKPLHELAPEEWDSVMNVNLRAPYLMIRAFAPAMIEARYGHVVNISSLAGRNPLPNGAVYSASKWGLNGLTYSVAEELRPYNIRVSVVAPGSVNTHFGGVSDDAEKSARKIQPEDVASVVGMLVTQAPQSFVSEVLIRPTTKP